MEEREEILQCGVDDPPHKESNKEREIRPRKAEVRQEASYQTKSSSPSIEGSSDAETPAGGKPPERHDSFVLRIIGCG